jgi:hypothetical protein
MLLSVCVHGCGTLGDKRPFFVAARSGCVRSDRFNAGRPAYNRYAADLLRWIDLLPHDHPDREAARAKLRALRPKALQATDEVWSLKIRYALRLRDYRPGEPSLSGPPRSTAICSTPPPCRRPSRRCAEPYCPGPASSLIQGFFSLLKLSHSRAWYNYLQLPRSTVQWQRATRRS